MPCTTMLKSLLTTSIVMSLISTGEMTSMSSIIAAGTRLVVVLRRTVVSSIHQMSTLPVEIL